MLRLEDIKAHTFKIAQAKLGNEVKDVVVSDDIDHEGRPSLRVTIILRSKWSVDPPGNRLNEISRELSSYLSNNADERFAFTHYMTAREFSDSHDRTKPTARRRRAAG